MAYENLCMYCFKDLGNGSVCPHCGKDARAAVPQIQMLPGTPVYRDRFLIGRALGQDASGIVYIAMDTKRGGTIRIREYLPRNCAERLNDGTVIPIPGMEDTFDAGMRKLRASVDGVDDPKKRHFYFEENGTAYIAQRKNIAGGSSAPSRDYADDEDAADHRKQIVLYIAIAAAVVLAVAIGVIWFLNSIGSTDDVTLSNPLSTTSPGATWMPAQTPTPTPYATATFAALVDPELSWMDYTYSGDVNNDYQQQVNASATQKPTVDTNQNYNTINGSSSETSVQSLQEHLVRLGWLDYSNITGEYDAATKQAVKDFQDYVNNHCSPAKKLAVDGIAGKQTQQWLYNASVSLTRPTPTPTPLVTAAPDDSIVNENSPEVDIRALQNKLITLGVMQPGTADGRYGAATAAAVKNFQNRVNQLQGYTALEVTGKVDELTMAYLNYYIQWWEDMHQATATPSPETTPNPTQLIETPAPTEVPVPTDTAQPIETVQPTRDPNAVIDANSSKEEVKLVQEMLSQVGLLSASGVDGVFGNGTSTAIKTFQNWVNEVRMEPTLEVTGVCDPLTRTYLEYCIQNGLTAQPTQAPTEQPTEQPTQEPELPTEEPEYEPGEGEGETGTGSTTIDPSSPVESISYVQEMLADVGLLDASDVDGQYGEKTKEAIRNLQQFINEQDSGQALEITGICDSETLNALIYYYDRGWIIGSANQPENPEDSTLDDGISPASPAESIAYVQEMLAEVGLLDASAVDGQYGEKTKEAVRSLQQYYNEQNGQQLLEVTGLCDVATLEALMYCYDRGWVIGSANQPAPTEVPEAGNQNGDITPDSSADSISYMQEMLAGVGLLSDSAVDGDYGNGTKEAVRKLQQFINDMQGQQVLEVTGICDAATLQYLQICFDEGWNLSDSGDEPEVTEEPTQQPIETPTEEPQPDPTEEPAEEIVVGTISNVSVSVSGMESGGSRIELNPGRHDVVWQAEGDLAAYYLYLFDGNNTLLKSAEGTDTTGFTMDTATMTPGMVYELRVGALPVNGTMDDIVWQVVQMVLPVQITPEPTATPEPTPEPTAKPSVSAPSINIGSSVYQQDGITYINDSTIIFSWMASGDVESFTVDLVYEDGTTYSLGTTTDTSKTVTASQLMPGLYKLYVGATPYGGGSEDTVWSELLFGVPAPEPEPEPEPMPEPEPEPEPDPEPEVEETLISYLDASSNPDDIQTVQMALYRFGLLNADNVQPGVLDLGTLEATAAFQQRVNEMFGANLNVIDPASSSFIDGETLNYLLYQGLDIAAA